MKLLVLGGTGYLGSKVVNMLSEKDHVIVCTKRKQSKMSRIKHPEKIILVPATDDAIETLLNFVDFDMILNMACHYGKDEKLYGDVIEANIGFPLKILNMTAKKGVRFLTIGTALPDQTSMYSFSKKVFSDFGKYYAEKCGVDFYNLKLEMFYGADEPKERFIPSVIENCIWGKSIFTTFGSQHRDIIAVEDVLFAISAIMNSGLKGYHEIPVGTGIAPTISELVDYIAECTKTNSMIRKGVIPARKDEPDCIADIMPISSICNWNPIPWKVGILAMIEEMKKDIKDSKIYDGRKE